MSKHVGQATIFTAYNSAAQKVDRDLPVDHKGFAGRSHDIPLKIYNQNYKGKYL